MPELFPIPGPALILFLWSAIEHFRRWGGLGLIVLGLLDSSFIPLPGSMDALTVVLATSNKAWWPYYAMMATVGSVIGGYLTYRVGRKGGEKALEKKVSKKKIKKVYRAFEKGGFTAVFVPAMLPPPVPMVPFLVAAGALNYSPRKFLAALAAGRAIRYFGVAFLASLYGRAILGFFSKYYRPILWTFVGLAVLGALAGVAYWLHHRRNSRQEQPTRRSSKDAA